MRNILWAGLTSLGVLLSSEATSYDKNYSLHGSRASFLMVDDQWMTLGYLHEDAQKNKMMDAALASASSRGAMVAMRKTAAYASSTSTCCGSIGTLDQVASASFWRFHLLPPRDDHGMRGSDQRAQEIVYRRRARDVEK